MLHPAGKEREENRRGQKPFFRFPPLQKRHRKAPQQQGEEVPHEPVGPEEGVLPPAIQHEDGKQLVKRLEQHIRHRNAPHAAQGKPGKIPGAEHKCRHMEEVDHPVKPQPLPAGKQLQQVAEHNQKDEQPLQIVQPQVPAGQSGLFHSAHASFSGHTLILYHAFAALSTAFFPQGANRPRRRRFRRGHGNETGVMPFWGPLPSSGPVFWPGGTPAAR